MLVHVPLLSMWEIAHYWHGHDPRGSGTHDVPLDVRDVLLVLSMSFGNKISLRAEHDKAYLLEIANAAPRFTARHYRHTIRKAIDSKVFGKRFFSNLFLSRSQLGRWCIDHKEPLPVFWFPDNDKYPFSESGDLSHEITANGRFKVQLLYDDTMSSAMAADQVQGTIEPVTATVNQNAVKAARAKHAPTNAIKERFVQFFLENGAGYQSKIAAAEYFFEQLGKKEQLLFSGKGPAVRTLLDRLREARDEE